MNLFDTINEEIKKAMLAKEKTRLETLRFVKKEFLEAKTAKGSNGELTDDQALKIIQKMVKQRKETAIIYAEQNRPDLAENELAEVAVLETFLPKAMSEEDLTLALTSIIEEVGAAGMKDMGKVMGVASKKLAGKADGKAINEKVKQLLS
ncbi:GatB/YqeY domain-containing protein [Porphyromonadaceae bacterium]